MGAMSVVLYCFREREEVLKIFERFAGQRMMTSYIRIGGLALEPPAGLREMGKRFLAMMPAEGAGVVPPQREKMKTEMEALIYHFKIFTEGFSPPPGEVYVPVESPRGELGCFIASDGSPKPLRVHFRGPSFVNLQALPLMVKGQLIADTVASIGTIDIVLGEVDR